MGKQLRDGAAKQQQQRARDGEGYGRAPAQGSSCQRNRGEGAGSSPGPVRTPSPEVFPRGSQGRFSAQGGDFCSPAARGGGRRVTQHGYPPHPFPVGLRLVLPTHHSASPGQPAEQRCHDSSALGPGQENPNRVTLRLCNLMFGVNAFQCLHQEYLQSRRQQGKLSKTRSVLSKTEEFLWHELLCKYRRIEGFSLLALPAEQLPAEERL